MTRKLLKLRLRLLWAERGDSVVFWLASVVAGLVFVVALWLAPRAFEPILATEPGAAEALVLIVFAAVGFFQLLASVRWAVDRLYLASDLELLLSAPVPLRSLYAAKVIEVMARSPVSLAVTFLAGYGLARAARSVGAVLLAVVAPLLLAASVAALGIALTTVIARVVPPARIKTVLMLLPAVIGISFGIGGQLLGSRQADVEDGGPGQVLEGLAAVGDALRWIPTSWPGSIVTSASAEDGMRLLVGTGLTLAAAVTAVALGFVSFRSSFHVTWGRVGEAAARRRRRSMLEGLALPLTPAARAIVIKDWRLTIRDLKRAMGILFPVLFIGFIAVRSIVEAPSEGAPGAVINLSLLVLVLGVSSVQSFVYEGESIWVLRSAPVDARTFFVAKLAAQALPTAVVVAVLSVVIAALGGVPVVGVLLGVMFAVIIVTGLGVLGLSFTLLLGDPGASKPGSNLVLSLVTMLGGGAFVAANIGVAAWLVATAGGRSGPLLHPAVGTTALVAAAAAWTATSLIAGRAIRRLVTIGFR